MKLISINIQNNLHNEKVLAFLVKEKPDVICLQELLEDDFDFYKKELGLDGVFQTCSYITTKTTPTLIGRKQGVGILTKNIIDSGFIFYKGQEKNVMMSFDEYMTNDDFRKNHALVWVNIKNTDGKSLKFITIHLPVTRQGESSPYQLEVVDLLLDKLNPLGEFILVGDTNAPRGNESFSRIAKNYCDNIPTYYKTSIDQNLHRVKGIQFMVDGLFTTAQCQASGVKLVDGISDHMAIVAEINNISHQM